MTVALALLVVAVLVLGLVGVRRERRASAKSANRRSRHSDEWMQGQLADVDPAHPAGNESTTASSEPMSMDPNSFARPRFGRAFTLDIDGTDEHS